MGRYLCETEIFGIAPTLGPGSGGDFQLAAALDALADVGRVQALLMSAKRYARKVVTA